MTRVVLTVLVAAVVISAPRSAIAQAREGIQVRGDWVMEVFNPDGTPAGRYEFQNALQPQGQTLLTKLLNVGSQPAIQGWTISLFGLAQDNSPWTIGAAQIGPSTLSWPSEPHLFKNLTIECCDDAVGFKLVGSAVAERDGSIANVGTFATREDATYFFSLAPAPRSNPNSAGLFLKQYQTIRVTVTISFHAATHTTGF